MKYEPRKQQASLFLQIDEVCKPFAPETILTVLNIAFCSGLFLYALYLENISGLVPCALCLAQRIMIILVALCGAIIIVSQSFRIRVVNIIVTISATIGGIFLAGRQAWLQSLPPESIPACGPDIYFALENFPIINVLQSMILGTGNCAEIQWTFLGISIPGWNLINFAILLISSIMIFMIIVKRKNLEINSHEKH